MPSFHINILLSQEKTLVLFSPFTCDYIKRQLLLSSPSPKTLIDLCICFSISRSRSIVHKFTPRASQSEYESSNKKRKSLLGWAFYLDAFTSYPLRTWLSSIYRGHDNWYTRGASFPVLSYQGKVLSML